MLAQLYSRTVRVTPNGRRIDFFENNLRLAKLSLRLKARESLSTESVNDCSAIVDAAKRHAFCKAEPSLLCMACTSLLRCGTSPQRSRKHLLYVCICHLARDYAHSASQNLICMRFNRSISVKNAQEKRRRAIRHQFSIA